MRKWLPLLVVVLLGLILFAVRQCASDVSETPSKPAREKPRDPASTPVNRDRGFDRRVSFLEYSDHARCRMKCRRISQEEVKEVMQTGSINYRKSDLQNARCPRYAVEGFTADRQRVRIVFAQCNEKTVVVTVIDLETDYACDCPGDDDKYKNRRP
jgi:hypothetical protein